MLSIRSQFAAFTLIEISITVGVFAVSIVAILALVPVGMRNADESRKESIVALIARTVLSDLRTGTFDKARIAKTPTPDFLEYDLAHAAPTPVYLGYNADGIVIGEIPTASYANPNPTADYIVKVESKLAVTTAPALTLVTVTIESPASAPASARKQHPVVTLMGRAR